MFIWLWTPVPTRQERESDARKLWLRRYGYHFLGAEAEKL